MTTKQIWILFGAMGVLAALFGFIGAAYVSGFCAGIMVLPVYMYWKAVRAQKGLSRAQTPANK